MAFPILDVAGDGLLGAAWRGANGLPHGQRRLHPAEALAALQGSCSTLRYGMNGTFKLFMCFGLPQFGSHFRSRDRAQPLLWR